MACEEKRGEGKGGAVWRAPMQRNGACGSGARWRVLGGTWHRRTAHMFVLPYLRNRWQVQTQQCTTNTDAVCSATQGILNLIHAQAKTHSSRRWVVEMGICAAPEMHATKHPEIVHRAHVSLSQVKACGGVTGPGEGAGGGLAVLT